MFPEAVPGVAYGPVDSDGYIIIVVVDVPSEVCEIPRCLFVHLTGIALVLRHIISVVASETVNAVVTVAIILSS